MLDNTYNFSGELTASTRTHTAGSSTTTIANRYEYDHMGRKLASFENINDKGEVVLLKLDYNELGQLKNKSQHSEDKVNFLQATGFAYNERGWLRNSINSQFSMQLDYNENGSGLYNGNIGRQSWSATSNPLSSGIYMSYGYDKLNRLSSSIGTGITMNETIAYDVLGNIDRFQRDNGTDNKYHYHGSQLWFAAEVTNGYEYDRNGNSTTDGRSGYHFDYNVLNLPKQVRGTNNQDLVAGYTYDATGDKLKKITPAGTINYIDGIHYKTDNSIDFIQTEEGLARNNGSGNYSYEYNLSDHLGNVRTTFYKNPSTNLLEVLQRDDYNAFGLRNSTQSGNNKYLYNGKELQEELGQYDYGARFYDPVIARWNAVNPLAELHHGINPYNYVLNNPLLYSDEFGLDTTRKNKPLEVTIVGRKINANIISIPIPRTIPTIAPIPPPNPILIFLAAFLLPSNWWETQRGFRPGEMPPGYDPRIVKTETTVEGLIAESEKIPIKIKSKMSFMNGKVEWRKQKKILHL